MMTTHYAQLAELVVASLYSYRQILSYREVPSSTPVGTIYFPLLILFTRLDKGGCRSLQRVYGESMRSPQGIIHKESMRSPCGVPGVHEESQESMRSPHYFRQSLWTPCGVFMDS